MAVSNHSLGPLPFREDGEEFRKMLFEEVPGCTDRCMKSSVQKLLVMHFGRALKAGVTPTVRHAADDYSLERNGGRRFLIGRISFISQSTPLLWSMEIHGRYSEREKNKESSGMTRVGSPTCPAPFAEFM